MPARLPFDRVATIYDETRAIPPKIMARLLHILVDELRGRRVLEIGVGTGRFAVPLQKTGIDVVGIDISRKMVDLGLTKGMRNVLYADGARLPFVAASFEVATTNHVLHLIPDWRDVLTEIVRVTRESYVTVIERSEGGTNLQREYHRLVEELGHTWSAPGLHERDLPVALAPDVVMPVGPIEQVVLANSVLDEIERRDFSSQWETPEAIHRQAVSALREAWAGRELRSTYSVDLCFWRVERLAALALAVPQRS